MCVQVEGDHCVVHGQTSVEQERHVKSRRGRTTSLRFGQNLDRYGCPQEAACGCLVQGLGHVKNSGDYLFTRLESLTGKDVTHERCSGCFELNLVRVEFKIMLGQTIQQIHDSAVMVPGGLC